MTTAQRLYKDRFSAEVRANDQLPLRGINNLYVAPATPPEALPAWEANTEFQVTVVLASGELDVMRYVAGSAATDGPRGDGWYPAQTRPAGFALWIDLAGAWTAEPIEIGGVTGATVFEYDRDGSKYYRRVPAVYDASQDTFFESWDGSALSGEIVSRG